MLSVCLYAITGELISIEFHIWDIFPIIRILVSTFIEAKHFLNKDRREKWIPFYEACPESIHPFYLANRSPGLDVTWQSVRGDLTVHPSSLYRGASKSAVRRRRLRLCAVWPSYSQISSLSTAILTLGKTRSHVEPNMGCSGADRPGWCNVLPKKPTREL